MCLQYLNKFWGASRRRRNNAANAGVSPRPSMPNVPQVSMDTVRTAKSAKSLKSGKPGKPVNVANNQLAASVNSMEKEPSVAAGSGANPAAVGSTAGGSGAGDIERFERRSTWWGYFGFGKKKRTSSESL